MFSGNNRTRLQREGALPGQRSANNCRHNKFVPRARGSSHEARASPLLVENRDVQLEKLLLDKLELRMVRLDTPQSGAATREHRGGVPRSSAEESAWIYRSAAASRLRTRSPRRASSSVLAHDHYVAKKKDVAASIPRTKLGASRPKANHVSAPASGPYSHHASNPREPPTSPAKHAGVHHGAGNKGSSNLFAVPHHHRAYTEESLPSPTFGGGAGSRQEERLGQPGKGQSRGKSEAERVGDPPARGIERALNQKLQELYQRNSANLKEKVFEVYRRTFEDIISEDHVYSQVLREIKETYEARIDSLVQANNGLLLISAVPKRGPEFDPKKCYKPTESGKGSRSTKSGDSGKEHHGAKRVAVPRLDLSRLQRPEATDLIELSGKDIDLSSKSVSGKRV